MAKNKIERIDQEITKVREKIAEYQEKLKALEAQKTEAENLEIVQMVRALPLTACKARFTFSCLVIAPGYEAGAPFHTGVKAVPAPVGITAHIAHLTLGQFHQL